MWAEAFRIWQSHICKTKVDHRETEDDCLQYHRDMPTQIKLVYDVAGNKLCADYAYEPILGKKADLTIHDVIDEWYQEMQQEG